MRRREDHSPRPGFAARDRPLRSRAAALALMDHPHVARVLDAGTAPSGRPYFVMELVEGIAIAKYCDQRQLSIRERLELFIPVCQAVQHAHQKGIIHRDLKPSNILVSEIDGWCISRRRSTSAWPRPLSRARCRGSRPRSRLDRGHAEVYEPRAGPAEPARCGHAERRVFVGRGALRTLDRDHALRQTAALRRGVRVRRCTSSSRRSRRSRAGG